MKRPHKYGAVATTVDGERFASKAEARRYSELRLLERAGVISDLKLQPRFPLKIGEHLICTYISDFEFIENGQRVVLDVKSKPTKTPVYIIKKKLMRAIYNIEIREVP